MSGSTFFFYCEGDQALMQVAHLWPVPILGDTWKLSGHCPEQQAPGGPA